MADGLFRWRMVCFAEQDAAVVVHDASSRHGEWCFNNWAGRWLSQPLWKIWVKVSWDDEIPNNYNYGSNNIHVPNHQPDYKTSNMDDWLMVYLPYWKMMEFVNGKDDIPYRKWNIKIIFETTNEMITGLYPPWLCFKALCLSFHISDQHLGTIELKKITSVTTIAWKAPVALGKIEFSTELPLQDGLHSQTQWGPRGIPCNQRSDEA